MLYEIINYIQSLQHQVEIHAYVFSIFLEFRLQDLINLSFTWRKLTCFFFPVPLNEA